MIIALPRTKPIHQHSSLHLHRLALVLGYVRLYISQTWTHHACPHVCTPRNKTGTNESSSGIPTVCVREIPKGLFLFHRFAFMALSCLLSQVCRNLRARHKSKNLVRLASWFRLFDIQPGVFSTVGFARQIRGTYARAGGVNPAERGLSHGSPSPTIPVFLPSQRDCGNSYRRCLLLGKPEQNNYCHHVFHPIFIVAIIFISVRG